MRILGNILWHIPFLGFVNALFAFLFGFLLTLTLVAAPIGLGLMQYAKFLLLPFSYDMMSSSELPGNRNPVWRAYSFVIMLLYLPFGLVAFVVGLVQAVGLALTIVGIPVALVVAKSLGTYLNPVGKVCVPYGTGEELRRKAVREYLDRNGAA